MRARIVLALAGKDLALFFRNRFIAVITVAGLALYIAMYFLLPSTVDEALRVGLYAPSLPDLPTSQEAGLAVRRASTEDELRTLVLDEICVAGVAVDLSVPILRLYLLAEIPAELRDALTVLVEELGHALAGDAAALEVDERVIGPDLLGRQVPPRDRLRPLVAVLLLVMEVLGLASLISEEIQHRTLQALLVTPVRAGDVWVAKGIAGMLLALGQAVLYMLIVRGFGVRPLLILAALTLGALMAVGVAFLIGALGRDFVSVVSWGVLFIVPLMIPAFSVLLPGAMSGWVRVLPTYYLVDSLNRAAAYGAGWADLGRNLAVLLGCDAALMAAGILALRRKMPWV